MTSSARATYSAVSAGNGFFNYEVKLENTSTGSYDIYSLMLGSQYSVPIGGPVLSDAVPVSAPPGWTGYATTVGIAWQTSFRTNSMDSGYILEGTASTFRFSSSTAPPSGLPFGCCFHHDIYWGYCYNSVAERHDDDNAGSDDPYYAEINPLALVLGDYLFARLNLPRPPSLNEQMRAHLMSAIEAMPAAQRDLAARSLEGHIDAMQEVRTALRVQSR